MVKVIEFMILNVIEKGFPSKAKMAGGGIALRGLGRAFRGGGKV